MMRLGQLCFNWRVLLALGAVGVGIWIVAPGLLLGALPLLLLAACPLTMLVMVWGMKRGMKGAHHDSPASPENSPKPAQIDSQERLVDLETKQAALQAEIARVKAETSQQTKTR